METVEVVIRIPKEQLERLQRIANGTWGLMNLNSEELAILNGTVLPKGHGDLKDVDEIERIWKKGNYVRSALLFAPTVIEADRDCEHCSRTYGTLGCCSTVSNKWVYSCEEGHREYEETHKEADKESDISGKTNSNS